MIDRFESEIVIPASNWRLMGDANTAVILGGRYYWSSGPSMLSMLETQINTLAGSFAVTLTPERKLSIVGTSIAITWIDSELRDLLGFEGDRAASSTHIGENQVKGSWTANADFDALNAGSDAGPIRSDYRASRSPDGSIHALFGNSFRENEITWDVVCRRKTWAANEAIKNESFETFVNDCIWGRASWARPGGPLRWYPDATDDAFFFDYRVGNFRDFEPKQRLPKSTLYWRLSLPSLTQVPA